MIIHNIEKGEYTEDREILDTILELKARPKSIETYKALVKLIPDDYHIWNKLKDHLKNNTDDFDDQLIVVEKALQNNVKSYYAWYHRQYLMTKYPHKLAKHMVRELKLTDFLLKHDPRNFHCWNYKMTVLNNTGLIDTTNYSSMHHNRVIDPLNVVFTDPLDDAAWFYLYSKREDERLKKGFYLKLYSDHMLIKFKDMFSGKLILDMGITLLHKQAVPTKSIKLNFVCNNPKIEMWNRKFTVAESNEDYRFLDDVINLEQNSIHAWLHKLELTSVVEERDKLIEKLCKMDPLRKGYYCGLREDYCKILTPTYETSAI